MIFEKIVPADLRTILAGTRRHDRLATLGTAHPVPRPQPGPLARFAAGVSGLGRRDRGADLVFVFNASATPPLVIDVGF